jgi:hypothetical protein
LYGGIRHGAGTVHVEIEVERLGVWIDFGRRAVHALNGGKAGNDVRALENALKPVALIERFADVPRLESLGEQLRAFGCGAAWVADEVALGELTVIGDGGVVIGAGPAGGAENFGVFKRLTLLAAALLSGGCGSGRRG